MSNLRRIFAPQSVAVIGASDAPTKVGGITLRNIIGGGFSGSIYPVNPRCPTIQGLKAYERIRNLPEPVDLAVVCTPATTVPEIVAECGEAGVGGVIILTAGFQEVGGQGRLAEEKLRQELKRFPKMRAVGPNCLGAIVPNSRLNASFAASMPEDGRLAFVSQSGALCTAVLDWARAESLGFSCFVSVGNMLDVSFADMLDYLAEDPLTDAVMLYVESIRNARAFMSAARACSRVKPIIAYKAGRFSESAQAAASHTGAMAGVDSVYEAAFERAGIVRVFDMNDLFDCAELLSRGPRVKGDRLAIVTNAGGPGVMACDALLARRGKLAQLDSATLARLDNLLPATWSHANPVDVLGDAEPERFATALQAVVEDPGVDAALAMITPQAMTDPTATAAHVVAIATKTHKPIIACWMGGPAMRPGIEVLNRGNVPTAPTPNQALAGFMNLVKYSRNLEILYETPRDVAIDFISDRAALRDTLEKHFLSSDDMLSEHQAKAFLTAYGIPTTEPILTTSVDEAIAVAGRIGFPVVLKVVSPQITHKTDAGGVELNLADDEQVRGAYQRISRNAQLAQPQAVVEAISVQPMIVRPGAIELIFGAKKDPVFGPVIMVGLGGIAAELFQDRALGLPPLNERLATHMLESLRAWPLMRGYRGRPAVANVDCLIEVLMRFSCLVSDYPEIAELDANPVLIRDDQVIALDARLVIDREAVARPGGRYSHLAIRPYPVEMVEQRQSPDGSTVTLRPIRPEDEPLWHRLLDDCSIESKWSRFRGGFKTDTHEAAIRFCFVDYDRELTVVAEATIDGERRLLGVARVVSGRATDDAEFAILVGDPWQGKGLGKMLTDFCLKNTDPAFVRRIFAETNRDNRRMIRIFERCGFDFEPAADPQVLRAAKWLGNSDSTGY